MRSRLATLLRRLADWLHREPGVRLEFGGAGSTTWELIPGRGVVVTVPTPEALGADGRPPASIDSLLTAAGMTGAPSAEGYSYDWPEGGVPKEPT